MNHRIATLVSAAIASCLCSPALAGDSGDPAGVGIRVVEIQGESIELSTTFGKLETSRTFDVTLGSDSSARMNLGLEVTGGGDDVQIDVVTGTVLLRQLGVGNTILQAADADLITLGDGSYLVSAGANASLRFTWSETQPFSDGDMTISEIQATQASLTFHPSGDTGALWLGTSGAPLSEVNASFYVFGGKDVVAERSLVWVNAVSGGGTFTMPDEGSDQVRTTFASGSHEMVIAPNSLLAIVLDRDEDSGDDGDAGCLGDLDGDGEVGGADMGLLLGAWGLCP